MRRLVLVLTLEGALHAHLQMITDQVVAALHQDTAAAIAAYDKGAEHMLMVSDVLSAGIVKQFPKRFGWQRPVRGAGMTELTMIEAGAGAPSDAEVVRRVLTGDRALFEVLMRRYNQRVYRAIRSILRDEQETEDAMQQAYLQAYSHLREFEGASPFSTWLTRIAINEALASLRKRRHLNLVDELPEVTEDVMRSSSKSPEDRAVAHESMRLLEMAVDKLPPMYRTAFMLREVEQLSTAETAASLGITEEAVKVRLHRARQFLRDALAETLGHSAPHAFSFLAPRCNRVVARVMAAVERGEV